MYKKISLHKVLLLSSWMYNFVYASYHKECKYGFLCFYAGVREVGRFRSNFLRELESATGNEISCKMLVKLCKKVHFRSLMFQT